MSAPTIYPLRKPTTAEIDILARTLWGEARGEGNIGMAAVASVIVNRTNLDLGNDGRPDWWGEGIAGVCQAPYQFSCWNKNDPNRTQLLSVTEPSDRLFVRARVIAELAAAGLLTDLTQGATHYHAVGVNPPWKKGATLSITIGKHLFYKGVR